MNKNLVKMEEKGLSSIIGIGLTVVILLIAASIFISSVRSYQSETSSAEEERNKRITEAIQTDVAIENAWFDSANDNIKVKAKNSGSTVLGVSKVQIFLDGKMVQSENVSNKLVDGYQTDIWKPTENFTINIVNQTSKPEVVKIVVEHGISDYFTKTGGV